MTTQRVHIPTIDGSTITLDVDGEVFFETEENGKTKRYSAWPNVTLIREIKEWAEARIDYEEKPLRQARDEWAFKLYNMPYSHLDFGGPRDIVDKVVAETTTGLIENN